MDEALRLQLVGAFLGLAYRYWLIIIVVILIVLGLIWYARGRRT